MPCLHGRNVLLYFRECDIFILDRCFRDAITFLHELGYNALISKTNDKNKRRNDLMLLQDRSYYGEHIRVISAYKIEVCRQNVHVLNSNSYLLRGRIQSRHVSREIYYTYCSLTPPQYSEIPAAISVYYCSCLAGRRTVCSCARVMSVAWFLFWACHRVVTEPPAMLISSPCLGVTRT
ncbi:uncharacterized protein LOC133529199 [Cydia pomonella]|uniref:uncharacterized protein LOC133529199 n=1 Tax=Cydia pomonella TaxID=82600 RepID=UPI002ADE8B61|nr:uncharacterized protein LOC133529199 [Cydia pomonella]